MIPTFNLTTLAGEMVDPFRPQRVALLQGLEVSLLVAEGRASWFRQVPHDEILLVLEGVIRLEGPAGRLIVNEGELATAERNARHHVQSGMRSTVLLIQELRHGVEANGQQLPDGVKPGTLTRFAAATEVLAAAPFEWLPAGTVGAYGAHATRLLGASNSVLVPAESMMTVVYRGVLDYEADGQQGTLVGGQMLVAGQGTHLTLRSERGATVLWLAGRGTSLPRPVAGARDEPGVGDGV